MWFIETNGRCRHWDDPRHHGKNTSCSRWTSWNASGWDSFRPLDRVTVLVYLYRIQCRLGLSQEVDGSIDHVPANVEESHDPRAAVCFCLSVLSVVEV